MRSKLVSMAVVALVPLLFHTPTAELFEFPKILAVYLLVALYLIWLGFELFRNQKFRLFLTPLSLMIFLWFVSAAVSSLFSLHLPTSIFGYYSRFTGGLLNVGCYLVLTQVMTTATFNKKDRKEIYWVLMVSLSLTVFYAFLQKIGLDATSWVEDSRSRVFSTIGQPNWLAQYLVALLPLIVFLHKEQKLNRKYLALLLVMAVLAVLFTYSASGLLSLGVITTIYLFWSERFIEFRQKALISIPIIVALMIIGFGQTNIQERISQTGSIREIVWRGSLETFTRAPLANKLLGFGPGNFAYAFLGSRPVELNQTVEWDYLFNKPHNEFLDFLINQGLVGLIWLTSLFALITFMVVKPRSSPSEEAKLLYLGTLAIGITSFFGFLVVPTTIPLIFYSIILGIETGYTREIKIKLEHLGLRSVFGILIIASGALLMMITGRIFLADYYYAKADDLGSQSFSLLAVKNLEKATSLNPLEPRYQVSLGFYLTRLAKESKDPELKKTQSDAAAGALISGINQNPRNSVNLRSALYTFLELGEINPEYIEPGLKMALHAREIIPTDPTLRVLVARFYLAKGDLEMAQKSLNEALVLKPDHPMGLFLKSEWGEKYQLSF